MQIQNFLNKCKVSPVLSSADSRTDVLVTLASFPIGQVYLSRWKARPPTEVVHVGEAEEGIVC